MGAEAHGQRTGRQFTRDRETAGGPRRQLVVSGDHCRHSDDPRHAGQREKQSASADDVRQRGAAANAAAG